MSKKIIYLIDGSSFLYRAYYALGTLTAPDGTPVQAVYGFCRMIKRAIDKFSPEYMAVVWDSPGKTVRHELFEAYKATRQAVPSDLFQQKELIKEFADLIGLKQYAVTGIEADDLLASLARELSTTGHPVVIISSDKDLGQLVTENVKLYDPFKDKILDVEALEKAYGFPLTKLPFYYALVGDASDNIPGVRGIGPKTATTLVQQFDSLDDLYNNLNTVKREQTRLLLEKNRDNAFLSQKLFQIQYPPLPITVEELTLEPHTFNRGLPLFERLRFSSLMKEQDNPVQSAMAGSSLKPINYAFTAITTEKELAHLCTTIKQKKECAIDTETDSLKVLQTTLVGISICYKKGSAFYIPVAHKQPDAPTNDHLPDDHVQMVIGGSQDSILNREESQNKENQLTLSTILKHLGPIFEDSSIKKYMHNAKFDLLVLRSTTKIKIKGLAFDTMVAAGLIREDGGQLPQIGLKALSEFYLHEKMLSFKEMVTDKKLTSFAQVPVELATQYAAADAHQTWCLVDVLQNALKEQNLDSLYDTLEHPLIQVLCDMEWEGIDVDVEILKALDKKATLKLNALQREIGDLVGMSETELNLNSPQQVSALLFERLKLAPVRKTSGKSAYSTDIDVLTELAKTHPVPALIIRYRELSKLKSTYLVALQKEVNPTTDRIHTTFNHTTVATGRLASVEPNLQNIPAETDLPGIDDHFSVRSAFKAPPQCLLISADYSQIELRVLAHLSQDITLKNAFLNNEDIHARTAAGIFEIPLTDVSRDQRQIAKRINFSILYGLTPYGLSKDLNISQHDAKLYIEKYLAQYSGVQAWMEQAVEEAKKYGYVTTLWGRRRPVPGIYEKNHTLYQLARRIAINTKVQGTAADLMKCGMIELSNKLKQKLPDVKILLQIHDELILSTPKNKVTEASTLIQETLQKVVEWDIPLTVHLSSGLTWQEVSK